MKAKIQIPRYRIIHTGCIVKMGTSVKTIRVILRDIGIKLRQQDEKRSMLLGRGALSFSSLRSRERIDGR